MTGYPSMKLSLLYFANLGEALNTPQEALELADNTLSVSELIERLSERGDQWQSLLSHPSTRCAVNQTLAEPSTQLNDGDEIAFFPPVTGG